MNANPIILTQFNVLPELSRNGEVGTSAATTFYVEASPDDQNYYEVGRFQDIDQAEIFAQNYARTNRVYTRVVIYQ